MKYNAVADHENIFEVPALYPLCDAVYVGLTPLGPDRDYDGAVRWAYSVGTGPWDADVVYQGDHLHAPVLHRQQPDAAVNAATTLLSFLSAYAEGELRTVPDDIDGFGTRAELYYDGDVIATGDAAEFIHENGERFGLTAYDIEEGNAVWESGRTVIGPHSAYGTWSARRFHYHTSLHDLDEESNW